MKKINKDDEPLVRGGQGRSDRDVEETVQMLIWICLFGVIAIGLIFVLERVLG